MTISAKIIADSTNDWSTVYDDEIPARITTMELEYPRFIHSEFMTHRMFSRNAASSRAIPIVKMIEQVKTNPAMPIHWGKNQAGMQAGVELDDIQKEAAKLSWIAAANEAASRANILASIGLHKQVVNRILEPFQTIKVVVTATEWENFFWLRDHPDAQPEIRELAKHMKKALAESIPQDLQEGMWHLPYVKTEVGFIGEDGDMFQLFFDEDGKQIDLEQAIKISCSSCAQVSYRRLDTSIEKAEDIYKKLIESEPVHASAFEHQARATDNYLIGDEEGVTHMESLSRGINGWSGNFKNWIQYRQLIPNNVKRG